MRPLPKFDLSTAILLLASLLLAEAGQCDALNDRVNGPLTGIFGIPDSSEGGRLLPAGASAWSVSYGVASHSIDRSNADESVYLDGESSRLELRYRHAFSDRLEIGVELPFVQHEAGNLDAIIDSWHQFFGLPQGRRPGREQDILAFSYVDGAEDIVDVSEGAHGVGDIRAFGGWKLLATEGHDLALRFGVKFPTGSSSDFLGSGGTDISIGLAGDVDALFGIERLSAFYRANAIYLGEPEFLADRYQDLVGHVSLGAGFRITQRIDLRVQGAVRGALYDSSIDYLGDTSTTLTFGGNIDLGDRFQLSIAIGEDIDVSTAPDVSFLLALRYRGE